MSLLAGKVVCITGASRGIGRACAVESAKYGATGLILHYYGDSETENEINALKQEVEKDYPHSKVATVPGDIADPKTSVKVSNIIRGPMYRVCAHLRDWSGGRSLCQCVRAHRQVRKLFLKG